MIRRMEENHLLFTFGHRYVFGLGFRDRAMAQSLGFEGHIAWTETVTECR